MPVEINELHIRLTVNAAEGKPSEQQTTGNAGKSSDGDRQAIIAECKFNAVTFFPADDFYTWFYIRLAVLYAV